MVASAPAAGGGVTSAPLVLCAIYMLYMVEWYTQHAVAFAARLDLGVGRSDAQVCCLYSFCTIHFTLDGRGPGHTRVTSHDSRVRPVGFCFLGSVSSLVGLYYPLSRCGRTPPCGLSGY